MTEQHQSNNNDPNYTNQTIQWARESLQRRRKELQAKKNCIWASYDAANLLVLNVHTGQTQYHHWGWIRIRDIPISDVGDRTMLTEANVPTAERLASSKRLLITQHNWTG